MAAREPSPRAMTTARRRRRPRPVRRSRLPSPAAPGDLTTGASFELAADAARGAESPEAALAANPAFGRAEPQAATSSTGRRDFRRAAADDDHAYLVHELAGRAVSWVSATRTSDGSWTLDSYLACNTFFVANGGI